MSHLTSETCDVWVPVLYNEQDERIKEGGEHHLEEFAVEEAREMVAYYVDLTDAYYYARIEHRIVPTYK